MTEWREWLRALVIAAALAVGALLGYSAGQQAEQDRRPVVTTVPPTTATSSTTTAATTEAPMPDEPDAAPIGTPTNPQQAVGPEPEPVTPEPPAATTTTTEAPIGSPENPEQSYATGEASTTTTTTPG